MIAFLVMKGGMSDYFTGWKVFFRDFGNTQLTVEHVNIPDDDFGNIAEGWREYYIGAIENFLNPNF